MEEKMDISKESRQAMAASTEKQSTLPTDQNQGDHHKEFRREKRYLEALQAIGPEVQMPSPKKGQRTILVHARIVASEFRQGEQIQESTAKPVTEVRQPPKTSKTMGAQEEIPTSPGEPAQTRNISLESE